MRLLLSLMILTLITSSFAGAAKEGGVSLNRTRVVFSSMDKAQSIMVKNSGKQNYLIQSRVQRNFADQAATPFVVTPPLVPLAGNSSQLLRILKQDEALPTDRESLFYLTVLAIPAQAEPVEHEARLSVGFQHAIKLFYRPEGLKITPEQASCQLLVTTTAQGVRIANPTPYFLTLASLTFDNQLIDLDDQSSMIAPMSRQDYPAQTARQASWQTINDFGGLSAPCQRALL